MRFGSYATSLVVALVSSTSCVRDGPMGPRLGPLQELPADLAAVTFTATGRTTAPYVMLELRQPGGFTGFVAVNERGEPVWYFRTVGSPFGFARRASGTFVLLDSERGVLEVGRDGRVLAELAQQARPGRRLHHDLAVTRRNTVVVIAEEWRDLRGELVNGEAIWEWDPEGGSVARRWSAFDHLDPALDRGARSRADDWLHANSIAFGARGNILLSLHFLDQVLSIAPDYSALEWRLGGARATHAVDEPFSGQHTAQEVAPDELLLFDNGFARADDRYSRAVQYRLAATSAEAVWQWRPQRNNWARVISGARRLPNGHTLVGFGTPENMPAGSTGPIEAYEVTADGRVVWHLVVGGAVSSMYRATPLGEF